MASNVMRGRDAVYAGLAEVYITIEGRRYNFFQMTNFEAKFEKTKVEVPILGQTGMGHKSTGWSGTGTATAHYNQSVLREYFERYKNTGEDVYCEIQVANEDPTSGAGRQTIVFTDVNFNGGILAKFEAGGGILSEDVEFTFDGFSMPERFNELPGM